MDDLNRVIRRIEKVGQLVAKNSLVAERIPLDFACHA